MNSIELSKYTLGLMLVVSLLTGCNRALSEPNVTPTSIPPTSIPAGVRLAANLSIETIYDTATPLIIDGAAVPMELTKIFSTAHDNQVSIEIHLVQGNSSVASENTSIGKWQISGFPSVAPKGKPNAKVTFRVEADGLVTIKAVLDGKGLDVQLMSDGTPRLQLRK